MKPVLRCLVIVASLASASAGAPDPSASYAAALAKVHSSHRAIAERWYALVDRSQPAPAPSLLRLDIPRFSGNAILRVEFPLADGMAGRANSWVFYGGQYYASPCDAAKVAYDAGSSTVKGTLKLTLPAGCDAGPAAARRAADRMGAGRDAPPPVGQKEELTITLDAAVAQGRVTGTFTCTEAKSKGALTGEIVTPAAGATGRIRGLAEIDPKRLGTAEQYALAVALERDAFEMYRWIRALTAAGGERGRFAACLDADAIPVPERPSFIVAKAPPPPAAPPRGKGKSITPKAPSIDDVIDGAAPKVTPDSGAAADKATRERLPLMEAMALTTASLADLAGRAQTATPIAEIQHGRALDDPLFGPWYGNSSLVVAGGATNRLPPDAGAPGVQDWPFIHGWRFLGPFDFAAPKWDAIRLPDCAPVANTEYEGKVGPVKWQQATIAASGCAVFTDLDSYSAVEEVEEQPTSPATRPVRTAVYYGATSIEAERDTELLLAAGCCGRMSVWIDDVLVARGPTGEHPDDITKETLIFTARLHRGVNRLLVRCEAAAYGLFTHRRPGTASYFWMRACVRGAPGDAKASQAWLATVNDRKKNLPNLPPNVRGFRGDQTGFFPDADPPTAWDIDRGINVRWTTAIERWSKASPLVAGDKVFVCAEPHVLVCLDAQSGKILWRRSANVLELIDPALFAASAKLETAYLEAKATLAPKLAELGPNYAARLRALATQGRELPRAVAELRDMEKEPQQKYAKFADHLRANGKLVAPAWDGHFTGPWLGYTFATPVTDGKRVYVQFRTGVTAAFDLEGKRIWMVHTPYATGGVGVCSSPVLADDKLIISQSSDPGRTDALVMLTAFEAATGRVAWKAKADSRSQISSPVVMRLTDGKQDMAVIITDGGTVVRADDGRALLNGLRGGSGTASPTPVGDILYRIENAQGGAVQLIMLDRDHVGARWLWSCTGVYNAIYAGFGHHGGILFGTCHGGSQCIGPRGLDLVSAATGLPIERPFNQDARTRKQGIFAIARGGFIPPTASPRAIYISIRGKWHASSLQEELPDRWTPYTCITVAQHGPLGRFIAHNKVVGPMTPHLAIAGDRLYLRNDQELTCCAYTGDEGRAYEAEVNAATILDDIPDDPPADPQAASLWREGIAHARPFLDRVIALKPDSAAAVRAKAIVARAARP